MQKHATGWEKKKDPGNTQSVVVQRDHFVEVAWRYYQNQEELKEIGIGTSQARAATARPSSRGSWQS